MSGMGVNLGVLMVGRLFISSCVNTDSNWQFNTCAFLSFSEIKQPLDFKVDMPKVSFLRLLISDQNFCLIQHIRF